MQIPLRPTCNYSPAVFIGTLIGFPLDYGTDDFVIQWRSSQISCASRGSTRWVVRQQAYPTCTWARVRILQSRREIALCIQSAIKGNPLTPWRKPHPLHRDFYIHHSPPHSFSERKDEETLAWIRLFYPWISIYVQSVCVYVWLIWQLELELLV